MVYIYMLIKIYIKLVSVIFSLTFVSLIIYKIFLLFWYFRIIYGKTVCYKPILINKKIYHHTVDILLDIHKNNIFNFTYNKVKFRKFVELKKLISDLTIRKILTKIILYYFEINKILFLRYAYLIYKNRNYIDSLLISHYSLYNDQRLLIYYNGKWVANPWIEKKFLTKEQALKLLQIRNEKSINIAKNFKPLRTSMGFLKNINSKIPHLLHLDLFKDNTIIGTETDYYKAKSNNFYNKEIILEKFTREKPTTILKESSYDIEKFEFGNKKLIINQADLIEQLSYTKIDKNTFSDIVNENLSILEKQNALEFQRLKEEDMDEFLEKYTKFE